MCRQYGPVIRLRCYCSNPFLEEIEFLRTTKTDDLKAQSEIQIGDTSNSIEWLNDKSFCVEMPRVADSLESPPDQQSPRNILNCLHDDCLRAIFESNCLSLADLCSVGSVCSHFNAIAKQVCARKYKDTKKCLESPPLKSLWKIEEYLRIANVVSIDHWDFEESSSPFVFGMIVEHCTDLRKLYWYLFHQELLDALRPIIDDLTHLNVWCNSKLDLTDAFTASASLESLQISHMDDGSMLPSIQLPKLTKLTFTRVDADEASIERFLQLNRQLKVLSLSECMLYDDGLERALKHLPNTEELEMLDNPDRREEDGYGRIDFVPIHRLKHLKTLHFEGSGWVFKDLIRVLVEKQTALDCLILDNPEYENNYPMAEIGQLKNIKSLRIGRLDEKTLLEFCRAAGDYADVEVFSERLSFTAIRDALRATNRPMKIVFRLLLIDEAWLEWDADVLDELGEIRAEGDIDLTVVVETGEYYQEIGDDEVSCWEIDR